MGVVWLLGSSLALQWDKFPQGGANLGNLCLGVALGPLFQKLQFIPWNNFPWRDPIPDHNSLIFIPYPRVNCLKTIPFTAAQAHIWHFPPPGGGGVCYGFSLSLSLSFAGNRNFTCNCNVQLHLWVFTERLVNVMVCRRSTKHSVVKDRIKLAC